MLAISLVHFRWVARINRSIATAVTRPQHRLSGTSGTRRVKGRQGSLTDPGSTRVDTAKFSSATCQPPASNNGGATHSTTGGPIMLTTTGSDNIIFTTNLPAGTFVTATSANLCNPSDPFPTQSSFL